MNRIGNILTTVTKRNAFKKLAIAAALVGGLSVATTSFADRNDRDDRHSDRYDHRDDRHDDHRYDHHDDVRVNIDLRGGYAHPAPPRFEERTTQVWVEPVYRSVCDRVWVAPEYRVETTREYREPLYRDEANQVWVPDRWEERTTRTGSGHWNATRTERVLVERGHFETRCTQVLVKEGGWHNVDRQVLVCDGHWTEVQRQELVAPGHFETRVERVACDEPARPAGMGWFFSFGR